MINTLITYLLPGIVFWFLTAGALQPAGSDVMVSHEEEPDSLLARLGLEQKLDAKVFSKAMQGMKKYNFTNDSLITIIDYTKASDQKRMFIIDIKNELLLYHILVAHGKNSGTHFARFFSNRPGSLKSSPGFYRTAETYSGKHGYSLKLDGLEKGINDRARERLIVIHGADYVSKTFIKRHGRIGRSWGCPAVPVELSKEVIDLIKGGSCLYIHVKKAKK
jgi:hypothetical protein